MLNKKFIIKITKLEWLTMKKLIQKVMLVEKAKSASYRMSEADCYTWQKLFTQLKLGLEGNWLEIVINGG